MLSPLQCVRRQPRSDLPAQPISATISAIDSESPCANPSSPAQRSGAGILIRPQSRANLPLSCHLLQRAFCRQRLQHQIFRPASFKASVCIAALSYETSFSQFTAPDKRQTYACMRERVPAKEQDFESGNLLRKEGRTAMHSQRKSRTPEAHCARDGPLPLLPSGPGGIGGVSSRKTDVRPASILPRPFSSFISAAERKLSPLSARPATRTELLYT